MKIVVVTYKYRIKDGSAHKALNRMARAVNTVWNYANATSYKAVRDYGKWISSTEMDSLVAGTSKELGLHSQTIQAVTQEYILKRRQFKKRKLRWRVSRSARRSLGWIPWKASGVKIEGDRIRFSKHCFRFWKSRDLPSKPKCGSFTQDASGRWYVNIVVEVAQSEIPTWKHEDVGVDPGLKDIAVFSDGNKVKNPAIFLKFEEKLGYFQKHHKKKQARKLSAKIRNIRLNFIHEQTLKLVKKYQTFFMGDVSGKFLQASHGKSSQDASIGLFRSILRYKAHRHQGRVIDVSEFASSRTCSTCLEKTGPSGLSDLGVREWKCNLCGDQHDRDINAAKNILRLGRETLKQSERAA